MAHLEEIPLGDKKKGKKKKKKKTPLIWRILPSKRDKPAEAIRKTVFICSICVLIGCGVYFSSEIIFIWQESKSYSKYMKLKNTSDFNAEDVPHEMLDEYKPYYAENSDFVGWITIPNPEDPNSPVIDYPVMQTTDNEYYVNHNFYREEIRTGEIFADYRGIIGEYTRPGNTILYGHNMYTGSYFAKLTRYKDVEYYKTHPIIDFDTLYDRGQYKVFAGIFTNTLEKYGEVFPYWKKQYFEDKADFDEYVSEVLDRSYFYTDVDLLYGDEILTLSTCWFEFAKDDGRFVVFARRIRDGETAGVDISKAYQNPNPKFFDRYYAIMGGSWQGRTWNPELLR